MKKHSPLRFGVAGIGVGASQVLPPISNSPYSVLCAAADVNPRVRKGFSEAYPDARVYGGIEELCSDPDVEAVWISTPNRYHADHAVFAAERGKHVLISKPMATSLAEADRIIEATRRHGVKLLVGHSLGFSPAIRRMASLTRADGRLGPVRAIQMMAFTDWMLLPRTAEEVDVSLGGGIVHRQAPHQIDTIRFLGGGMVRSVRGTVGQWAPERKAPGYYAGFLAFESGAVGTLSYNGYGYLVGPELVPWGADAGISGNNVQQRAQYRARLKSGSLDEEALKDAMRLGGGGRGLPAVRDARKPWMPLHHGLVVVSCERGDVRHSAFGLYVYDDEGRSEIPVEDDGTWLGSDEIAELHHAVRENKPIGRDGEWGMATLEVAMAIMQSQELGAEVVLRHQVPVRPAMLAE